MTYIKFLNDLESIQGNNAKVDFAKTAGQAEQQLMKLACDTSVTFNYTAKNLPEARGEIQDEDARKMFLSLSEALFMRTLSGNRAKETMNKFFTVCTPDQQKWFSRIINRGIVDGFGASLLNKAFPGMVYQFAIMKPAQLKQAAKKILEGTAGIEFPIWADTKKDGYRCVIKLWDMVALSSSGKCFLNWDVVLDSLEAKCLDTNYVLDGEIVYSGDEHDEFNGIQRSAFKVLPKDQKPTKIRFEVFDILTKAEWEAQECSADLKTRQLRSRDVFGCYWSEGSVSDHVGFVVGEYFENAEDLIRVFDAVVAGGGEGLVIKRQGPYQWKRHKTWLKLKASETLDVEITGYTEGEGKYAGNLGAIQFRYKGGESSCGTGFKDEQRADLWANRYLLVGSVMEVSFHKDTGKGNTRHCVYQRMREDKTLDQVSE